ncbi:DNA-directed RNA polymerase subunit RPC12/RpoP [Agrobacterium tumefaciens]|uniref:DUF4145 domain-containing protein n=1 Tax=Agrobacterium tumefaciens TaxID=358 RepID=UPI001AE93C20|nr:DUF4145 domain-containing protein [Agrobacterium tumefaciens]MBP2538143.1 DNA-directed RNA polymerase subunit RPC12/RpoP [Agrobacterium tumefaciens]
MQRVDITAVRGGSISGQTLRPAAVSAVCGHCNSRVIFSLANFSTTGPKNSVSSEARCPACGEKVAFWCLNPSGSPSFEGAEIYMHPPSTNYFPVPETVELLPDPLRRALTATIEAYNARIYSAAAVSGRRTLEGIFKYLVPEEKRKQPLAKLIDIVKSERDLSAPLGQLSHAIRNGGNLGAHFDMQHEPDETVARQIVELLCYLISYLYVLPTKIEQLETDLNKSDAAEI